VSDASQGPGWWQASDGKWYPPEQAPGYQPADAAGGGGGGGAPAALDIGAALSYGWNKFIQYIGQILVIFLIIIGVQIVLNFIGQASGSTIVSLLFSLVGFVVSMMLSVGLVRAALAITEGRTPEPSMLFSTDNLGPYIIASILYGLLLLVGFALCIVWIAVIFFFWFYGFFVVDRNAGPTDALMGSFNLVKDNAGSVAVFMLVVIVLSLCTCGLAWPILFISSAYVYKTLNGQSVAA
jgi:uncharacterized membrane protein